MKNSHTSGSLFTKKKFQLLIKYFLHGINRHANIGIVEH